MGEAGTKIRAQEHPLRRIGAMIGNGLAGIPGCPQTDAAEPSTARNQVCIQDPGDGIPEHKIAVPTIPAAMWTGP